MFYTIRLLDYCSLWRYIRSVWQTQFLLSWCCSVHTIIIRRLEVAERDGRLKRIGLDFKYSFLAYYSYNGYTREATFAIGLQRIDRSDVEKVKKIIDATFDNVIE